MNVFHNEAACADPLIICLFNVHKHCADAVANFNFVYQLDVHVLFKSSKLCCWIHLSSVVHLYCDRFFSMSGWGFLRGWTAASTH